MLTGALFTIARTCKQSRCPLPHEWIKRSWCVRTLEYLITRGIFVWLLFSVVLNLPHLSSFKSQQQSRAIAAFTFTLTFPDSSSVPLDPPPTAGRPGAHVSPASAPGAPRLPRLTRGGGLGACGLISSRERDRRARLDRRLGRKEAAPERGGLRGRVWG